MTLEISRQRAVEVIAALRNGTVPRQGLALLAVGLDHFERTLDEELAQVEGGGARFKAVRGEYGSGKTFFARWLEERARGRGFVTSEVQVSESETPLHKLQTVYRRLIERLTTTETQQGAFRAVIDQWFFVLEEDVLREGKLREDDAEGLSRRTTELMEQRLAAVSKVAPAFTAALRGYHRALGEGENGVAEGLLAWIGAQPNVGAAIRRYAQIKGAVDHDAALCFLQGLLVLLRDAGYAGLLLVLDEVETLQRVRSDVRDKGLNGLRQLVDELDGGRFPGLYVAITGTPAFFDGPQGVQRLTPLAQRLHVDFQTDARFDNPRAVQIRLRGFQHDRLCEVGRRVREVYGRTTAHGERIRRVVDDTYIASLARAVTGELGGRVGIAPRVFLKKLVADVLDRVDQFPDFDPRKDYALTVASGELTEVERNARAASDPDDVELDL